MLYACIHFAMGDYTLAFFTGATGQQLGFIIFHHLMLMVQHIIFSISFNTNTDMEFLFLAYSKPINPANFTLSLLKGTKSKLARTDYF